MAIVFTSAPALAAGPAEMISSFRLKHGEGRVTLDPVLTVIAHDQAAAMAAKTLLDHGVLGPFNARMAPAKAGIAAENIAYGHDGFPKTLDQWIGSPGHRKNLLLRGATRIAGGYERPAAKPAKPAPAAKRPPAEPKQSCRIKLLGLCL
jgi:uncharacterized protein YkwD